MMMIVNCDEDADKYLPSFKSRQQEVSLTTILFYIFLFDFLNERDRF